LPSKQKQNTRTVIVTAAIVVIVLAAAAAVIANGSKTDAPSKAKQEFSDVKAIGNVLAPLPESAGSPDSSLGKAAPRIRGESFSGSEQSFDIGSKATVIVFIAHWCSHCQRELPLLAKWAKLGVRNGVAVRAVATHTDTNRPNYPPSAWLERESFTIPTIADDANGTIANAYGLTAFPYFVAIDARGNVASRATGELSEAQFDELIGKAQG
jgi:cytochrome c biogenesis protein CcmG, thiol:disulfide interchange protein DsbE